MADLAHQMIGGADPGATRRDLPTLTAAPPGAAVPPDPFACRSPGDFPGGTAVANG